MFRPLLLSKKSRFSRTSLTYTYILMELTLSKRLFRYALTFHAPPRVSDTTQVRETGTFSVPEIHPSGPDGPAGQGACSQIKQFYSYFLMFKSVTVAFSDDQTTVAPRSDSCGVTPIDPALPITIPSSGPRSIIIILSWSCLINSNSAASVSPVRADHPDITTGKTMAHLLEIRCLELELKYYNL